ncbi:MAG: GNAT family N-acetyltransferase [Nitrososphaerales archaeon]
MKIDFAILTIGKASEGDADKIISLLDNAAERVQSKGIDQWRPGSFDREKLLARIRDGEVYVTIYEGSIVGTFRVQMHDKSVWGERDSNEDYAYIHHLAINPDFKGQQLGLQLLHQAETIAMSLGKKGIRLDCMLGNPSLENYYENTAGYMPVGISTPPGYTARLFEKRLAE